MKVRWAILCSSSAVDNETNSISLFNIIEEVTVLGIPPQTADVDKREQIFLGPRLQLVIMWERSQLGAPERGRGRVQIHDPEDTLVAGGDIEVDLTIHERLRARVNFPGLPIRRPGTIKFQVEYSEQGQTWIHMAEVPLVLKFDTEVPDRPVAS